jgi:ATPase subunit of ABC transporter with duplicated ATPase domains
VIVGSSLNVEIGDRVLLDDASFVVGAGEKVGLVGRNGAGKSSLISVLVGEPPAQVRSQGNIRVTGTLGWLPQVPPPGGLGLDPSGFSHVLSARGLDVLDDALEQARRQMAKDPTTEAIQHFADLEQQFGENGGYEAEAVMGRLAAGSVAGSTSSASCSRGPTSWSWTSPPTTSTWRPSSG